ncbi:hypothetical protein Vadar_018417 [Vaccinium darrowii]|uniref:Uncharacterized protein n=1 Tax=Vaccinium darrowii TaxID=229202 RepID=A0ACB7X272_9ERIC|nr:hypothetical protein Vadar_018417 [Vaccinium darrowii]
MLLGYFCDYTSSATYQTNRDTLFSSLSAGVNKYGYYSSSHGEDPDKVYAMVLCRADAELDLCRECINNATAKLGACPANKPPSGWGDFDPNDKEGIVWYDYCTVRYSSKVMEGIMAGDPRIYVWNDKHNVTSVQLEPFKTTMRNLLNNLRVQAVEGGTRRKFASGNAQGPDNYTIYALTQCTPDLSKQDCSDCLQGAIDNYPLCCNTSAGGRVLRPSCNFRYEVGPFFREIPGEGNNRTRTIIVIVASVTTFVIVLIVSISILLRKKNQGKPRMNVEFTESGDGISSVESLQYDFNTVKVATDNFSDANKLGQGGFGAVYKVISALNDVPNQTRDGIMLHYLITENVAERPTMGSVLLMFGSSSLALSDPSLPQFFQHSITPGTNESTQTVNEVSISELDPR